jgi:hypothetical protein
VLFSHGPNKTVQVPDSCRGTVTVYVPINLIQTMLVSALFRQFGSYFEHLGLQNKHNIHILSVNIKFICICCETGQKSLLVYMFLKPVQINFISPDNAHILYIFHFTSSTNLSHCGSYHIELEFTSTQWHLCLSSLHFESLIPAWRKVS